MAKRTKYEVHNIEGETARFSLLRHALLFAVMLSDRMPRHLIEVSGKDGLAGQYIGGKPTPEFKQHHIAGVFH
jgi:hypothetical protein